METSALLALSVPPSPSTLLAKVPGLENLETNRHLAKAKHPQVNLCRIDPSP